jgi:hypothetical protein
MLNFNRTQPGRVEIHHDNGINCGDLIVGSDVLWAWWPPAERTGCWPDYAIKEIYDKLRELNEPVERQINEFFSDAEGRN